MSLWELATNAERPVEVVLIGVVILSSLIQISPIKINPWDSFLAWFGCKINSAMLKQLESVASRLDKHIEESEVIELQNKRQSILNFCSECMNGKKHTKEQFDFVIKACDEYESYVAEKGIKNGVVVLSIKEIRRLYQKCFRENSFLKGGDSDETE